jgi:hypothetical protein
MAPAVRTGSSWHSGSAPSAAAGSPQATAAATAALKEANRGRWVISVLPRVICLFPAERRRLRLFIRMMRVNRFFRVRRTLCDTLGRMATTGSRCRNSSALLLLEDLNVSPSGASERPARASAWNSPERRIRIALAKRRVPGPDTPYRPLAQLASSVSRSASAARWASAARSASICRQTRTLALCSSSVRAKACPPVPSATK